MARPLPKMPEREVKNSVLDVEELSFPKLQCTRYCRDVYFDFVAPGVTPEDFYFYFMDKTGWPRLEFCGMIGGREIEFTCNKQHKIYFRFQDKNKAVNGFTLDEWVKPFMDKKRDTRSKEELSLQRIIYASRLSLGMAVSEVETYGFE